ncbi:MAG: His/Gly/Thr/Pro-type tRNA ligase C-terminal domain-containing protein, partial [Chitinophagales bacterium]
FLAMLCNALHEEVVNADTRVVLKIPPVLAPVKVAVLPLMKKDGLAEKALEVYNDLKYHYQCQYDEKDSIGKRYRRQDAIGTPYCITIDHQTLEDATVTLRERDSMQQERISMHLIEQRVRERVDMNSILKLLK